MWHRDCWPTYHVLAQLMAVVWLAHVQRTKAECCITYFTRCTSGGAVQRLRFHPLATLQLVLVALPPPSFVFARAPMPNAVVCSSLRSSEFTSCMLNLDRSNLQSRSAGAADQFVSLFVFATFQGRLVWPAFCHGIFFVQRDFVRDCIARPFHVATLSFWVLHFVVRKHNEDAVRLRLEQRTRDATKAEGAV